jgi:hypothetical protein
MKINSKLLSIGLLFAVIISLVWGGHQCTGRQRWEETSVKLAERLKADSAKYAENAARWEKDSVKQIGVILTLKDQLNEAMSLATEFKARYEGAVAVSDRQIDELSYRDKQIGLLRALVGNKTLPAAYLDNPQLIAVPDTAVLTAAFKTAKRAEIAEKGVDSLSTAVATGWTEIRRLKTQSLRDRETSLFAEQKLRNLAKRKGLFTKSRRKQADEDADEVAKKREGDISDLERIENKLK